jgi:hypothetical protein
MGRRPSRERKETVTIRLTPKARHKVNDLKLAFQRRQGWGGTKKFTNSQVIEQAIGYYFKCKEVDFKTEFTMCGACGQSRRNLE